MRRNNKNSGIGGFSAGATFGFIVTGAIIGWIAASYFEAQAFTRATGKDVSILDAMFTELRVTGDAK